jgi:hypothetical protein
MRGIFMLAGLAGLAVLLAACSKSASPPADGETAASDGAMQEAAPASVPAGNGAPMHLALLGSQDCSHVLAYYSQALAVRDYAAALKAWRVDGMTADMIAAGLNGVENPVVSFGEEEVEGAAGSLYCTADFALADTAATTPARRGQITLKRINDVAGASPEQLEWRITEFTLEGSSTGLAAAAQGSGQGSGQGEGQRAGQP